MKKIQKKVAQDPLDRWLYVILATVAVAMAILFWMYYDKNVDAKPLKVRVMLDNRCELFDEAFMAVSEPDVLILTKVWQYWKRRHAHAYLSGQATGTLIFSLRPASTKPSRRW